MMPRSSGPTCLKHTMSLIKKMLFSMFFTKKPCYFLPKKCQKFCSALNNWALLFRCRFFRFDLLKKILITLIWILSFNFNTSK